MEDKQVVIVTDLDVSFINMVFLVFKFYFASIVAIAPIFLTIYLIAYFTGFSIWEALAALILLS